MEILAFVVTYGAWAWIIGGLILLALELVAPGGILLWLGVAGILTGIASIFQPIPWPFQWMIFGTLALVAIWVWMRYYKGRSEESDRPFLNRRADRYIGQEAVLAYPIVNGSGRVALGDTMWLVSGPDLPAGERIRIVGAESTVLRVEAIPH